jgi:hypothetical protein
MIIHRIKCIVEKKNLSSKLKDGLRLNLPPIFFWKDGKIIFFQSGGNLMVNSSFILL